MLYLYLRLTMKRVFFFMLTAAIVVGVRTTQLRAQVLSPTEWFCIKTPHVDLIFKGGIHREAQRIANTVEHLYEPVAQSLGVKPDRIPLIIDSQRAYSNGHYARPLPHVVFFAFPSQDCNWLGTNEWLNRLAVHEFRHVAQYAKLHQRFNRLSHWVGGDFLRQNWITFNVPGWFMEGDAVGIETALSWSGRGRIPKFSLLYKTNLLERGGFSYYKQVFGSFKEKIPNEYRLGYYLTTHLRRHYGTTVLADILEQTTRPRLLDTAIKNATGKNLLQIYKDTNQELKALWTKQLSGLEFTQATRLNPRADSAYTDYSFPQPYNNTDLIVFKSGIGTVGQFVLLGGPKQEQQLCIPHYINDGTGFSVAQGQIVWVEANVPDPMWENRSYGVIQRYDIQKKRLKTLTHKSRYSAAALSPDGTKLVATECDEGYNHRLVILDADNGRVLQRLPNPDNHFYLNPRWSADGKQVVVIKHVQQKTTIALIDVATGAMQDLLPYSTQHIGLPVMQGQYVFYNSAYSGIDNIYAVDLATRQQYQVTSRKYGAYNPAVSADGRWLFFNDFTKDGMDVVRMPLDPQQWIPLEKVEDRSIRYYAPLVTQENNSDVLTTVPSHKYPVKRCHPRKYFNIHSWLMCHEFKADWNTMDPQDPFEGIQKIKGNIITAADLLGTTKLTVDYLHDFKQQYGTTTAKLCYKGWYPHITLDGKLKRKYAAQVRYDPAVSLVLKLPWKFRRGQYTHNFSLGTKGELGSIDDQTYYQQTYYGTFVRFAKMSTRDIDSPWYQELSIIYKHYPYAEPGVLAEAELYSSTFSPSMTLQFPGLLKHHVLRLIPKYTSKKGYAHKPEELTVLVERGHVLLPPEGGWDVKRNGEDCKIYYPFLTKEPKSKTEKIYREVCIHEKEFGAAIKYDLPICYPDWNLNHLLYVKRLRIEGGYGFEYTHTSYNVDPRFQPERIKDPTTKFENQVSIALLADMHLFTFLNLPKVKVGVTYIYGIETGKGVFGFTFESK